MKKATTKYRCVGCRPVAGQSRFVASKRTALDGRQWWCIYDQKRRKYLEGCKFRLRRECEERIAFKLQYRWNDHLPELTFEPDGANANGKKA